MFHKNHPNNLQTHKVWIISLIQKKKLTRNLNNFRMCIFGVKTMQIKELDFVGELQSLAGNCQPLAKV